METNIYMVRHAESPFVHGEERTRRLSEEGRSHAKKAAELLMDRRIDHIVSSPYTRAVETVEELAASKGLTIRKYEELKERPIKGLEFKLPEHEIHEAIEKSFEDKSFCLENGETTLQAQNRAIPVIKKLLRDYEGESIAIGTHGNIMTIIMNYFNDDYGYEFWKNTSKPDIYRLIFTNEKLDCVERIWSE